MAILAVYGLQIELGPWMSTVVLYCLVPQWQCISSFIFYIELRSKDGPSQLVHNIIFRQTGIPCGTLEIVIQEVLWSIRGSYWAIWSNPLTNVKWHSDPWPTVTSLPIGLSTNFMTFIPSLTFTELWVVSMEHLQRVWLASRERLPFRRPGSVPHFGTC